MQSSEELSEQRPTAPWWRRNLRFNLLALALLVSLIFHVLTWLVISHVRSLAREQLELLAEQAQQAQSEEITVSIQFQHSVPLQVDIPVQKQINVPIKHNVHIEQQMEIPLDTGFGVFPVQVPINLDIPIDLNVPVTFSETINVSTTVDLDIDTPLTISLSDTTLSGYLEQLREKLLALSKQL